MTATRLPAPASPSDALRVEEVRRTRAFLRVGWIIAVGVAIALPIVPGDPRIAWALAAALAVGVAGSAWMYRALRDPAAYRPARMNLLALAGVVCGQLGILYVGAFSAAPVMVLLGLYFFCRTERTASAIAIYATAAGAHALEAGLMIAGAIRDPGFYPVGRHASVPAQIAGQLCVQVAYALCFWLARATRRTSLDAIAELQHATRLAAQRDVQLAELRADLDRAREVGAPGRFTDHTVGSWQLGNVLGRGAMGEVYEAHHTATGAPAAVKLLRRELLADPRHVERFIREVQLASAIDSPHVVRVLEAATPGGAPAETSNDGLPFLAMEQLRGKTLAELLRGQGTLTGGELAALLTQTGRAFEAARAAGIVHRDVKPHNLFRCDDGTGARTGAGTWKVLDFGIAALADSTSTLTHGGVIGTPAYMSPEQARGEPVDHRADVYALGAVIYRCVTGRVPFAAGDTPSLLHAVIHDMPLRPSAIARVDPGLDRVILLALAKARDARLASVAELVAAFEAAAAGALPEPLVRRADALARAHPWSEPAR
ncbi:MAG TPA: serine/threonine-protein kinase [Kofleriaceae bacterium]|jgi:serine/threonine-protein kinase|nr:serine/threonine-protein kinase [Kofleriaceae bacterium]